MTFSVACLVLTTFRTCTGYRDTLKVTVWCNNYNIKRLWAHRRLLAEVAHMQRQPQL